MSQPMLGAVETVTNPVPLRETGDRTVVKTTPIGLAVGAGVAGARVAGACVTGACVGGTCVASATAAGACVGASVRGADDAVVGAGVVVAGGDTSGVAAGVAAACASETTTVSRFAGLPQPASANKTTQIVTENRFPKSHPSLIQL
jgi:hypothetical protein